MEMEAFFEPISLPIVYQLGRQTGFVTYRQTIVKLLQKYWCLKKCCANAMPKYYVQGTL